MDKLILVHYLNVGMMTTQKAKETEYFYIKKLFEDPNIINHVVLEHQQ